MQHALQKHPPQKLHDAHDVGHPPYPTLGRGASIFTGGFAVTAE
jgi:hypothetical protein